MEQMGRRDGRFLQVITGGTVVCLLSGYFDAPLYAAATPPLSFDTPSLLALVFLSLLIVSVLFFLRILALNRKKMTELVQSRRELFHSLQQELALTREQLKDQINETNQSRNKLKASEENLRQQVEAYRSTHNRLLDAEEMLKLQLDAVAESSQKFKAVFDHSPITVALTAFPEHSVTEVNQKFIDMYGYSREEIIGKTTAELGIWVSPEERSRYLKQLILDGGFVKNYETNMRRKNGELFPVLISGVHLEVAGKPCALNAVIEITELKRLQYQLAQSQKMDVIGQLTGGIVHDFNNMLAGIMASSELLKLRMVNDEKNKKLVDIIIDATARSAGLTRELLAFSRKEGVDSLPIHINVCIAAAMSLLERTIGKQIELVVRLEAGNPVVKGDQTQLQNALLNLAVNARDAMPQGGILTFATTVRLLDDFSCRSLGIILPTGSYLEIMVSDTGVGMSQAVLDRIFEPFFTTKEAGMVTGLGLTAVYGTVQNHGGEITVQSQPGVGTVFKIFLPLFEERTKPAVETRRAVTGKGGVLLVDDEELLRVIGQEMLEGLGYTVFLAKEGIRSLQAYDRHRDEISLVLMDVIMPKMGGKETFTQLRKRDPELKVLFCSGFLLEGAEKELMQMGGAGFIQKPFNRSDLSRVVASAMGL